MLDKESIQAVGSFSSAF